MKFRREQESVLHAVKKKTADRCQRAENHHRNGDVSAEIRFHESPQTIMRGLAGALRIWGFLH